MAFKLTTNKLTTLKGGGGGVRNVFEFSIGFQHDLFRRKSNFGVEPVSTIAIARTCSISLVSLKLFYLVTVDPDLDDWIQLKNCSGSLQRLARTLLVHVPVRKQRSLSFYEHFRV